MQCAGRCGIWGLRAPARCSTAPQGASGTTSKGSRLKLKLVRRNRAGHGCCVTCAKVSDPDPVRPASMSREKDRIANIRVKLRRLWASIQ